MPKKATPRKPAPKSKPAAAKAPDTLPKTIINALPAAARMMKCFVDAAALIPQLEKDLLAAKKAGAVPLARAFVALHRMDARFDELFKPIYGKDQLYDRYKMTEIPAAFEQAGVPSVTLDEGFRVGIAHRFFASIPPDMKAQAYNWLKSHGHADLISETVNSSTLSALAKELQEQNVELPTELFKVALVPTVSVNKA